MDDLEKYFVGTGGMIISIVSWELLQNIFISLILAFVGGFMAAMGRQMYKDYYERRKKKKGEK